MWAELTAPPGSFLCLEGEVSDVQRNLNFRNCSKLGLGTDWYSSIIRGTLRCGGNVRLGASIWDGDLRGGDISDVD